MLLLLLSFGSAGNLVAATQTSDPGIPPQLMAYYAAHPNFTGCLEGSLFPSFTIETCKSSEGINETDLVPQTSESVDCSAVCQAGTINVASSNYTLWNGFFTVPSKPTNLYGNSSSVSYWIGLSNCNANTSSCGEHGNANYDILIQSGLVYGQDGSNNSYHPALFNELYGTSGCSGNNYCGNDTNSHIRAGDSLYFEIRYLTSPSDHWLLFSQDSTSGTYISATFAMGSGTGEVPSSVTSLEYAIAAVEDHGFGSTSDFPGGSGTNSWTELLGEDATSTYQIGTASPFGVTGGFSDPLTFTVTDSQPSCDYGGTYYTCQTTNIAA
jgi:hypothetical protein